MAVSPERVFGSLEAPLIVLDKVLDKVHDKVLDKILDKVLDKVIDKMIYTIYTMYLKAST